MTPTPLELAEQHRDDCKRQLEIVEAECKARVNEAYQVFLDANLAFGVELAKTQIKENS